MPEPISRFPVPDIGEVPEDVRDAILEVEQATGFVPNVFLALAHRPAEFRAFFAMHEALMEPERESGLTKAEREMIVVATSGTNDCLYCVVAHGAILRIRAKDPHLADELAVNHRRGDVTPRQRAMLDYAMLVATDSSTIEEEHIAALEAHGFSRDDVWDIGAIAAMFAMSNRLANMAAIRPNDEFYAMAR